MRWGLAPSSFSWRQMIFLNHFICRQLNTVHRVSATRQHIPPNLATWRQVEPIERKCRMRRKHPNSKIDVLSGNGTRSAQNPKVTNFQTTENSGVNDAQKSQIVVNQWFSKSVHFLRSKITFSENLSFPLKYRYLVAI